MRRPLELRLPLAGAAALLALVALNHSVQATTLHRAALVVEHSSGRFVARCVSFVENQISGFQLIQRSGVEYQAQQFGSLGEAVCRLDYEPGQTPANCFGTSAYWQYFHRTPSGWAQSGVGASSWMLGNGDMDGWHYAAGAAPPPADLTFATVCASPVAPPPSATPTAPASVAPARTIGHIASQTPTASPSVEALAPSLSPTAPVALAGTGPPPSRPSPRDMRPLVLFGAGVVLLAGLAAWNLATGRGP